MPLFSLKTNVCLVTELASTTQLIGGGKLQLLLLQLGLTSTIYVNCRLQVRATTGLPPRTKSTPKVCLKVKVFMIRCLTLFSIVTGSDRLRGTRYQRAPASQLSAISTLDRSHAQILRYFTLIITNI